MSGISQDTGRESSFPIWFVIWLIQQVGGSVVLSQTEVLQAAEAAMTKQVVTWRDDLGRVFLEVKER